MSAEDCVGCRHINNCLGDCVGYKEAKPQEQTNEEWLRTLPVEERVKEVLSRDFMTEKRTAEEFVEWLKQPHND